LAAEYGTSHLWFHCDAQIGKAGATACLHVAQVEKEGKNTWSTLQDPLALLPNGLGEHATAIRQAVEAPSNKFLSEEQWKEYRQLQVDCAFLNAETRVLEKKLAYVQATAKTTN